jgi:hypothetical protein
MLEDSRESLARSESIAYPQLPRVSVRSTRDFSDVQSRQRPAVLVDALQSWPAIRKWTPEFFKCRFGTREYNAELDLPHDVPISYRAVNYTRRIRMADFVDLMLSPDTGQSHYIHQKSIDQFPGLEDDVDFESIVGRQQVELGKFLWVGSAGTKSSLHFDFHENILFQIYGRKRCFLIAPQQSSCLYAYSGIIHKSRVDPEAPEFSKFPKFKNAEITEATIGPGEALFIPRTWWHAVRSLDPSISVNYFYGACANMRELVPPIYGAGVRNWLVIARDFFWHGVLAAKYERPLYVLEPFGLWFYRQTIEWFTRRTAKHRGVSERHG